MIGLLIKDIYTLSTEIKLLLIFIAVMLVTQNDFLFGYGIFYAAILPVSALGYDERAKWNQLAATMPYSNSQLVGSKYLLGSLCAVCMAIFAAFAKLLGTSFGTAASMQEWLSLLFLILAAILLQAFLLPLMFWIGTERGRYLFILAVVIVTVCAMAFSESRQFLQLSTIHMSLLLPVTALFTASAFLLSFCLSKSAYRHRLC